MGKCYMLQSNAVSHWLGGNLESALSPIVGPWVLVKDGCDWSHPKACSSIHFFSVYTLKLDIFSSVNLTQLPMALSFWRSENTGIRNISLNLVSHWHYFKISDSRFLSCAFGWMYKIDIALLRCLLTKWPPFRRRHIQMHFREWKCMNCELNFIEICSLRSNWQWPSIGSNNDLAPNGRQAIVWTNDGSVYWRIYASLGLNELINIYASLGAHFINMDYL